MNPPAHRTTILACYNMDLAFHQWCVSCTCGYQGEWHITPRWAERDAETHTKAQVEDREKQATWKGKR